MVQGTCKQAHKNTQTTCAMLGYNNQNGPEETWPPPKRLKVTTAPKVELPEGMQEMEVPWEDLRDAIILWIVVSTLDGL